MEQFERTQMLIGEDAIKALNGASVAIFGIGGVGGYVVEALARAGVGCLALIDADTVSPSNLNRQIVALHSTLGKLKTNVAQSRAQDINPNIKIINLPLFYSAQNAREFELRQFDYVVDAIDTVSSKLELIVQAKAQGVPIISCMGAGNKMNPTDLEVADIYQTSVCPLAKIMRSQLRKHNIKDLKVVYSKEAPITPIANNQEDALDCGSFTLAARKKTTGSMPFTPAVAGLILASEVIKDLIKNT